jgi:predicted RNase H-like nuclease (RuvC/YqgF family)
MLSQICYFHPKGQKVSLDKVQAQAIEVTKPKKNYRKEVENSQHRLITETQYENVIKMLYNELNHLQNERARAIKGNSWQTDIEQKHLQQLVKTIDGIMDHKKNNKLSYSVLHNELTHLEKSLTLNNKKKSGIRIGFLKPHEDRAATATIAATAKTVNKLTQDTKPELQIPKMLRH